ncbi:MAG: M48 family metallopeptidase [Azonexus sp.]|jgi:predicted Zn-dependent protease|nr:M48 family metallopeptidase [Betaproteobacteria bacterium]MBK8917272.1 M48 family metallopeptidase [Betaproteobacteria bacterium]MBP6035035.1 M48 family metallopeptidase [Azonexus sp.]MBP6905987.1 M48 family metallopeptidase [Azonexus sp.]
MPLANRLTASALALLLTLSPARGDDLPDLGEASAGDLSPATEKKIGQKIMHEFRWRDPSYLDDPDIETYLNQLGGRLVAVSDDPAIGFYFFGVNDTSINAFAMPGGFIGVNAGLLLASQSESELAGVLAHEISHVTQRHIARQVMREKQLSMGTMLAMVVGLLAARSNSQVAGAAIATSQAGAIAAQLGYSRDFEREADRSGFEVLRKAGFDVRGMSIFFERLQRATRVYENNAPVYLRTHPVTGERISDMQNREQAVPYRQVPDSLEFQLVRAKLRAKQGTPAEARKDMQALVGDRKFASEAAARYGLAVALGRSRDWAGAEAEIQAVRKLKAESPMIDHLLAEARIGQGDAAGGLALYREAMARYALNYALIYGYAEALVALKRYAESLHFAETQLQIYPDDVRLHKFRAESYAGLGRRAQQHRALAEVFALQGQTQAAVEQLQWAQRAGDANFYELSVIDARLREMKKRLEDELKEKRRW